MIQNQKKLGPSVSDQKNVRLISVLWGWSRLRGGVNKWHKPVTQTNSRRGHAVCEYCQANNDEPAGEALGQELARINELRSDDWVQHGTD